MFFLPTEDQLELQRGVRDVLTDRFPLERLPAGYDADLWRALTETGVFALRTDLGLGLADAVLVFEELGRACVPGPLVSTFLAAGHADGPVALVEAEQTPLLVAHLEVATAVLVVGTDVRLAAVPQDATSVPDPIDPLSPLHELPRVPVGEPIDGIDAADVRREGWRSPQVSARQDLYRQGG